MMLKSLKQKIAKVGIGLFYVQDVYFFLQQHILRRHLTPLMHLN